RFAFTRSSFTKSAEGATAAPEPAGAAGKSARTTAKPARPATTRTRRLLRFFKCLRMLPVFPVLVVFLSFVRIAEHLVSFVDLLKFFVGFLVVGIQIGVMLPGQFAVRRPDLVLGSSLFYAQYFIIVDKIHTPKLPLSLTTGRWHSFFTARNKSLIMR